MKKILKEPLLHFLILGACLFGVNALVGSEDKNLAARDIVVSADDLTKMSNDWQLMMNRKPTLEELRGMVNDFIKQEIYYKEALRLGLDRNDKIIKRRLAQKISFLTKDISKVPEPDQQELKAYFDAHKADYNLPARVSFTQIYFSTDKREGANESAALVLSELKNNTEPGQMGELGDPFLLPNDFTDQTYEDLRKQMGEEFAKKVFGLPKGSWQGPVQSGYGVHLVYITGKEEEQEAELKEVLDKVRRDYENDFLDRYNKQYYENLKSKYTVRLDDAVQEVMKY